MTEQSLSSNPTFHDDFSTNPVNPNPALLNFITGLNVRQQNVIKSVWNSDTLTFSEKIASIDELGVIMAEKARREYRRWRFEHDKSSVNAFLEKQNPTVQNLIRLCLSSQSNLDEFYNSMLALLPIFDDKEAFINWANLEMLQSSSAFINDTNLMQNSQRNMSTNTVDGAHNKILFYMAYDESPNREGRICLFNSITFEVEIVEKFSTWAKPSEVATGEYKMFLIRGNDEEVFEIFNYETEQLTRGPDPPEWHINAFVAYYKNKLYYISGRDSKCVNILVNGKWQRGADFPIYVKYARQAICNDKLYIICHKAIFQLSEDEQKWIEVGKMKEEGYYFAVVSLNGKIYITGGNVSNTCLCFDPSQPFDRRFTSIASMTHRRYCHSLAVANGKLYSIGGIRITFFLMPKFCKSVEEYDPTTNRWRIVGKIELSGVGLK